ncbi:MAG: LPS export ABC transporter periplasmic protein LptC [Acidobacteria bacterium]|nr:LPS export ABC transporter periplasmic protein LptC [Acidobacteriota bacterium]
MNLKLAFFRRPHPAAQWQRPARLAVAGFMLLFAVIVYNSLRLRPAPVVSRPEPVEVNAVTDTRGAIAIQAKGSKEDVKVEAERSVGYADGMTKLERVRITVPSRSGRTFVVTAAEARIGADQSRFDVQGDVQLTASDGLTAKAQEATYDTREHVVRIPGPVTFARGGLAGTSVGATYEYGRDVLHLLESAHLSYNATGADPAEATAHTAEFARRGHYLHLQGQAHIIRAHRTMDADVALVHLTPDEQRVRRLELRGNARITGDSAGAGTLRAMQASNIDLVYADDGRALKEATLSNQASILVAGDPGQDDRRIAAESMAMSFATDGATLTELSARDRVDVQLPAENGGPARRIQSTVLEGHGTAPQGITAVRFSRNVEYREVRPAAKNRAPLNRVARSETLDLAIKQGFGSVDDAEFDGNVSFTDGALEAVSASAHYRIAQSLIELAIPDVPSVTPARVKDELSTVQARKVLLALEGGKMTAEGDVRSELQPRVDRRPGGATPPPEGLLKRDQPVFVTADHLEYERDAGRALYTGRARLWQGDTAVQAAAIAFDDRTRDLEAKGEVRSTMVVDQINAATKAKAQVTTTGAGEKMTYNDALRRITYSGNARLNGPPGDLAATRIEIFLDATGRGVARAEAYDAVKLQTEERSARGDRLTYFGHDERYLVSGAPVVILQQVDQQCRETSGRTVTFFKSRDTLTVDGNERTRTQTKSGATCAELRFD